MILEFETHFVAAITNAQNKIIAGTNGATGPDYQIANGVVIGDCHYFPIFFVEQCGAFNELVCRLFGWGIENFNIRIALARVG